MLRWIVMLAWGFLVATAAWASEAVPRTKPLFLWPGFEETEVAALPDLPEPLGVAGAFAGVHNDALIVAGGARFQDGGTQWLRAIHVLEKQPEGRHRWHAPAQTLRRPLAYGASVSTEEGVLCIGGQDGERCHGDVFRLRWDPEAKEVVREALPALPRPCANHAAAAVGRTVYVAGGQPSADATEALRSFWALDLSKPPSERQWETLPWPQGAPSRILAMAAAQNNGERTVLYLFGGVTRSVELPGRRVLQDAYAYDPVAGEWSPVADLPAPRAAGSVAPFGPFHVLIFGGDEGLPSAGEAAPGGSRALLAYHTITDTWVRAGQVPAARVAAPAVAWGEDVVIVGGEDRPGHASSRVVRAVPRKREGRFGAVNYTVLVAYLAALVAMGVYFSRREKTTDDFFLAGRRVPWWAAGLSIYGTQLSAITFISIPAAAYALHWAPFLANMAIVLVAPIVIFFYLPFFRRLNVTTAYEYLEKRFNVVVRLWGSVSFILYQLGRMGIVLLLPAIALSAATGLDLMLSIAVMGILCTVYTVLGGIEAVIWTDVLQVVVLLGGAIVSLIIVAASVDGGFAGMLRVARDYDKLHMLNWTWDYTTMAVWVVLVGNLFGNLVPYTADQAVVQRYLTTRDERQAARSIWTNALLCIPGSVLFFAIGTALFVFFRSQPQLLEPGLQADAIFPLFIVETLPAGVAGLVIAGVFAASMSSLDSSLNSVSTALVTDFYRRFKPDARDSACLLLARVLVVVLGVAATAAALYMGSYGGQIRNLWFLFAKILGLVGGSLAGIFALAIFTRRANGVGAIVGAIVGAALTLLVWQLDLTHFYLWAAISVLVTFFVGYGVSFFAPVRQDLAGLTIYTLGQRAP